MNKFMNKFMNKIQKFEQDECIGCCIMCKHAIYYEGAIDEDDFDCELPIIIDKMLLARNNRNGILALISCCVIIILLKIFVKDITALIICNVITILVYTRYPKYYRIKKRDK